MHEAIHMHTGFTILYCCCIFSSLLSGIMTWTRIIKWT